MTIVNDVPVTVVHAEHVCACPFSIAQDYAIDYLAEGRRGGLPAVMWVPGPWQLRLLRRAVKLSFQTGPDLSDGGRSHEEIRLAWDSGTRFIPSFRGTVRFRIAGSGQTVITIDGSYAPPGTLGAVFDRLIGCHMARRTMADLAERIGTELERREREWCSQHAFPASVRSS